MMFARENVCFAQCGGPDTKTKGRILFFSEEPARLHLEGGTLRFRSELLSHGAGTSLLSYGTLRGACRLDLAPPWATKH